MHFNQYRYTWDRCIVYCEKIENVQSVHGFGRKVKGKKLNKELKSKLEWKKLRICTMQTEYYELISVLMFIFHNTDKYKLTKWYMNVYNTYVQLIHNPFSSVGWLVRDTNPLSEDQKDILLVSGI